MEGTGVQGPGCQKGRGHDTTAPSWCLQWLSEGWALESKALGVSPRDAKISFPHVPNEENTGFTPQAIIGKIKC